MRKQYKEHSKVYSKLMNAFKRYKRLSKRDVPFFVLCRKPALVVALLLTEGVTELKINNRRVNLTDRTKLNLRTIYDYTFDLPMKSRKPKLSSKK